EKPSSPWLTPQLSVPRSLTVFSVCAPAGTSARTKVSKARSGRITVRFLKSRIWISRAVVASTVVWPKGRQQANITAGVTNARPAGGQAANPATPSPSFAADTAARRRDDGLSSCRQAMVAMGPCSPAQLRTGQGQQGLILDAVAMQVVAIGVEPALGAFDMVADAADDPPEPRRVVHLDEMGDLMGGEIVQHIGRRQDQSPGIRQRSGRGARSPAARLVTDRHPPDPHAEIRRVGK